MKASKAVSLVFLIILSLCLVDTQPVMSQSSGTIYIRADGSVEGTDKIHRDGNVYTFTDDINGSIVVEKDGIVIDGAGYALQGNGSGRGIDLSERSNVVVKNMQITHFYHAIYLPKFNNTFSGNYVANNDDGFWLLGCSNNTIIGNTITNNNQTIYIAYSSAFNVVTENNMINNFGDIIIWLEGPGNIIDRNYWSKYNGTDNDGDGIGDTPHTVINTNYATYKDYHPLMKPVNISAIIIVPDDYPTIGWAIGNASEGDTIFVKKGTYYENITIDKSLSLMGEDKKTTIIDGGYNRTVVTITRNGVNVTGFTIRNGKQVVFPPLPFPSEPKMGIHLRSAHYCNISGNNITNNDFSIVLYGSSDNSIVGNIITNSRKGIELESSSNNRLVENIITDNYWYGIGLHYSSNNSIAGNNITANRNEGVQIEESCQFNTIVGNTITNNNDGVMLWSYEGDYSLDSTKIIGNLISSNTVAGVLLVYTNNTNTYGNNITNNGYGVWLYGRYENAKFSHNNFINNNIQVDTFPYYSATWDNGYEGNYWDDYIGSDINGDGIGDTPYVIDENNQDNYPLMNPVVNPEFPGNEEPTTPTTEPSPITWIVAAIVIIAAVGAAFLVYFTKVKKTTGKAE